MIAFIRGFLVISAVVVMAGVLIALFRIEIPSANRDIIMALIGALIARSNQIDNFSFGSSHGSEAKTAALNDRLAIKDDVLELNKKDRV